MTERVEHVCVAIHLTEWINTVNARSPHRNIYIFAFVLHILENLFGHFACVFVVRCAFPMQWPKIERWPNFDWHKNVVCLRCIAELECGCMRWHRFVSQQTKDYTHVVFLCTNNWSVIFVYSSYHHQHAYFVLVISYHLCDVCAPQTNVLFSECKSNWIELFTANMRERKKTHKKRRNQRIWG